MEGNQPTNIPENNIPDNSQPDNLQPENPNIIRRNIPLFPAYPGWIGPTSVSPLFFSFIPRDTLQDSMNDEIPDKPAKKDFINSLEEISVDQEMIDQKVSCSICLDEFKINEKCIKLPCENPHYFHIGKNKDECEGVLPWFKINHNCPVCRCDFPIENSSESLPESEPYLIPEPEPEDEQNLEEGNQTSHVNELMNRFNQILREDPIENIIFPPLINNLNPINIHQIIDDVIDHEEDRQLQEAIRLSLDNN